MGVAGLMQILMDPELGEKVDRVVSLAVPLIQRINRDLVGLELFLEREGISQKDIDSRITILKGVSNGTMQKVRK